MPFGKNFFAYTCEYFVLSLWHNSHYCDRFVTRMIHFRYTPIKQV